MEPITLQYARPDSTPLVVCYLYTIVSYVPFLLTSWLLFKKKRCFESVVSVMVVCMGVTQGVLESHDKVYMWDNVASYPPHVTAVNGDISITFTWDQLTRFTWSGLTFIQWQKLLVQSWTTVTCMLLVMTMQNNNREVDRMYMALFSTSILILFEIAHHQNLPIARFAGLSIVFAFLLAIFKGADCRRRGNKRFIDQHQFLKASLFYVVAMLCFSMRYHGEARKNSLLRPFFGVSVFCAGFGSYFLVHAFTAKAMKDDELPPPTSVVRRNSVVLT
eukprot:GEMP01039497.1.p1 GENE.GEMP01039497.1~~GEMP01039497.1.p1  ORF type:complete len:275 (+),score=33.70 GEMP01039497.1:132-956(+)